MDAVLAHDLAALARAVRDEIDARGIRFESVDGDDTWHVDPVPRVIDGCRLGAGSRPASRSACAALNAFVADVYAERRIVAEGVLPQRVLDSAEHVEPALAGLRPRAGVWIGIAGLDLVRDARGRVARARGQRAHAERPRLLGGGARGDHAAARRCPRGPIAARRHPGRAAARVRRRQRGRADRRPGQLRLLGARLDRAAARDPAGDARPTSSCAATACCTTASRSTRSTGARTPTRSTPTSARC